MKFLILLLVFAVYADLSPVADSFPLHAEPWHHGESGEELLQETYSFVSIIDEQTQVKFIIEVDEDSIALIRYTFEPVEDDALYRSYVISPPSEWVSTGKDDASTRMKLKEGNSNYWFVPLAHPESFFPLEHGHVDFYCDEQEDLYVSMIYVQSMFKLNCVYQVYVKEAPVPMGKIEAGQNGEKMVSGGVLVIKAKSIQIEKG